MKKLCKVGRVNDVSLFDDTGSFWTWSAVVLYTSLFFSYMLTDVLFALLGVVILGKEIFQKSPNSLVRSVKIFGVFNWLLLGWFLSTVIGYWLSAGLGGEQIEEILGLRWLLSVFISAYIGSRLMLDARFFRITVLTTCLILITSFLVQYWGQFHSLFALNTFIRYEGFFGNASVAACALGVAWALCLGSFQIHSPRFINKQIPLSVLFITLSFCILMTQSRGTLLALFFVGAVYFVLNPSKKVFLGSLILLCVASVMIYNDIFYLKYRLIYAMDWSGGNSQGLRFGLWKAHWQIFLDHFWFGTGFREPLRLLPEYYARIGIDNRDYAGEVFYSHAHNQFLQTVSGAGVFGAFFFYSAFFVGLRYFWQILNDSSSEPVMRAASQVALLAIVAFLANGLFDCPFLIHPARVQLLLVTGLIVGYRHKQQFLKTTHSTG